MSELAPVILLAGGKSTRMGVHKGLLERDGRLWLEEQLATLASVGVSRVALILGYGADDYRRAITGRTLGGAGMAFEIAVNPAPEHGPFSSIQTGLRAVGGPAFILPIDVPCPGAEVWRALAQAAGGPDVRTCVPVHAGRGGHPVLLSRVFASELLALSPDDRLDQQLHRVPADTVRRVEVGDARVGLNINTPSDWESFENPP